MWMEKQFIVNLSKRILRSNKKEQTTEICINIDDFQKHHSKATCCMIPFKWHSGKTLEISDYQRLRAGEGELTTKGNKGTSRGGGDIQYLDCGGGYTPWKGWLVLYVGKYTSINNQSKKPLLSHFSFPITDLIIVMNCTVFYSSSSFSHSIRFVSIIMGPGTH